MLAFEVFRLHSQLFASSQCIVAYQYMLSLEYNNTSSHMFKTLHENGRDC